MARRWWWRIGRGLLVAVVAYFVVGSAMVWVGQWVFRWRAERLLADAARLGQDGQGSWVEFQAFEKRWGAWGSYEGDCTQTACDYNVNVQDWTGEVLYPAWLSGWKDQWKYSIPVEHAMVPLLWLNRAKVPGVSVYVQVEKGEPTPRRARLAVMVWKGITEDGSTDGGGPAYELIAGFRMSREDADFHRMPIPDWPELGPPADIQVQKPGGCMNCIAIWTAYNEKAKVAELEPLLKIEMSCITRWSSCRNEADIMPAAWKAYSAMMAVRDAQEKRLAVCDYPAGFLYQQAENAALMQVTDESDRQGGRKLRFERSLKGPVRLEPGAEYIVSQQNVGSFPSGLETVGREMLVLFPGVNEVSVRDEFQAYQCGMMPADAGAGLVVSGSSAATNANSLRE